MPSLATFGTSDLLVLDAIQREEAVPEDLKERIPALLDHGIVDRIGRGRGAQLILSRELYRFIGKPGAYTRAKGLDHETNKALLHRHIRESQARGVAINELEQVLPALSRRQIRLLIDVLRDEAKSAPPGNAGGRSGFRLWTGTVTYVHSLRPKNDPTHVFSIISVDV
jgi:ATP-dependent DNA helicase RecG